MLVLLIILSITFDVTRELCFKIAAGREAEHVSSPMPVRHRQIPHVQYGWTACGFLCWAVEIIIWTAVLAQLPLNVAFPLMSITYAATPLASWMFLGETISNRRWAGAGFVTAGAAIIGSTGMG